MSTIPEPQDWRARHASRAALDSAFTLDAVADLDALRRRRTDAADAARTVFPPRGPFAYGPEPGQTLLIVPPQGPVPDVGAPAQVFLHGGFWVSMAAREFTFLSRGFAPFGAALVLVDYPLIPSVRLADIVASCRTALAWLRAHGAAHGIDPDRLFLSGNSAGGHLVAELMDDPACGFVRGGTAISGLYDLAPVAASFRNDTLALTPQEVAALSPLRRPPRITAPLVVTVGGDETAEFLWQSAVYADHVRRAGGEVETVAVPGADHITVVLDALASPLSPLNQAVRRQMDLSDPTARGRWAISTGSRFEEMAGYSRAVVDGDWIFVSGTAGFDVSTGTISDDPVEQTRQALATISDALARAGASLVDVVRIRVYVADRADVVTVSRVLGATFAPPRPANTTIVCGFAEESMKVELEVTALRRSDAG